MSFRAPGKVIELAFVRFKATAKNPSFPIVYLAGGPGGSGISLAKGARFPVFMATREVGDVIALDQRGAGLSKPHLTCEENLDYPLDQATEKDDTFKFPNTFDEQLKLLNDLAKKDKQLSEKIPDFIELVREVFAKLEKAPAEIEVLDSQTKQNIKIKLGLLCLKFSRDDESQADELGVRYMTRTHHDPHQMGEVMTMLDRVSQVGGEGGRVPEWLATHPNPENRREHIAELIKTTTSTNGSGVINRESYLRQLDGMVFGQNPREGFFKGNTFFQPDLKLRIFGQKIL